MCVEACVHLCVRESEIERKTVQGENTSTACISICAYTVCVFPTIIEFVCVGLCMCVCPATQFCVSRDRGTLKLVRDVA